MHFSNESYLVDPASGDKLMSERERGERERERERERDLCPYVPVCLISRIFRINLTEFFE